MIKKENKGREEKKAKMMRLGFLKGVLRDSLSKSKNPSCFSSIMV
jgi:hypothetical protein